MSARTLPAAAVPAGAVVQYVADVDEHGATWRNVEISRVHNADPVAGRIRWETTGSGDVIVGGADRVTVLALP